MERPEAGDFHPQKIADEAGRSPCCKDDQRCKYSELSQLTGCTLHFSPCLVFSSLACSHSDTDLVTLRARTLGSNRPSVRFAIETSAVILSSRTHTRDAKMMENPFTI